MRWHESRRFILVAIMMVSLASCDEASGSERDDLGEDTANHPADVAADTVDGASLDAGIDTAVAEPDTAEVATDTSSPTDTSPADTSLADASGDTAPSDTVTKPGLQICVGTPFDPGAAQGFEHTASDLLVALAHPEHSAQDVIGHPGVSQSVPGKFAYGRFSKDLEDEFIELFVDACAGWQRVGRSTTTSDGRTTTALDPNTFGLGTGVYDMRQVVLGDATVVPSTLRLLPAGTQLVVFDIDGTLTTGDSEVFTDAIDEFFLPIYNGDYVPERYPSAVEITQLLASKGYVIIYLTGRPYWLTRITRAWLAELGFAPGHLHLTDSNGEALPTESGTGAYKRDYLRTLQSLGYEIVYAYGNATTDIFAYGEAGIPVDRTWIIGEYGGDGGTQPLVDGYTEHLTTAAAFPAAQQPY